MSKPTKTPGVGRPSNKAQRSEEIMQALMRCVARFGIEGATLSSVAEEAGLSRPLIRHHLGNRDNLIAQLQGFVLTRLNEGIDALVSALDGMKDAKSVVHILFAAEGHSNPSITLAFAALTAHARKDDALKEGCRKIILRMEDEIAKFLEPHMPSRSAAQDCAHGIIAIYFNVTAFEALDMPQSWAKRARDLSLHLIDMTGKPT